MLDPCRTRNPRAPQPQAGRNPHPVGRDSLVATGEPPPTVAQLVRKFNDGRGYVSPNELGRWLETSGLAHVDDTGHVTVNERGRALIDALRLAVPARRGPGA